MSKDESDTYLKFGQGILIQGFKTDDHKGFLTAKGFADSQAKYETYEDILYFKNYRNTIFQILPSSNFEINDEYRKAKEAGDTEEANREILKARSQSEKIQFDLSIKGKDKNKVCFGNTVIFKHIDSETYLSGTLRPSSGSNGAFTVEVSNNMSQAMVFRLLPHRSYEFEGRPIPFDCPIKIKNQYNNGFLTFERLNMESVKDQKTTLFEKKLIPGDDSYKIPVKTNSTASRIYECVTYFVDLSEEKEVPMPWKFKLHMNDVDNDILIQHDIVYLQHTENNGVLTASKGKIVLKEMKGQTTSELCFYECLWEIEKYGRENGNDNEYILRHLMSGMTLGIQKDQETKNPKYPKLVDITEGFQVELGYIELQTAKKEGGDINSESFVNVCLGQYCLDVKKKDHNYRDYEGIEMEEEIKDKRVDKNKMKELALNQQQYIEKELEFSLDISKHCFVIMQIADELKKDLLFALSFHSKIIQLREDLKFGSVEAVKKVTYLRMMQVTDKIRQIKDFLKNCTGDEAQQDHIHPIKKRQMICKDLGISELLFQLLYYMKKNEEDHIFQNKHNQLEKFHELYNTCYEVIIQLIRNNYLFKVHVTKWIMFVIDDVIGSNQPSRLNALKEILKNNTYFVNNLVTEELIVNLKREMTAEQGSKTKLKNQKQTTDFIEIKYLQIFRSLCLVGGKVDTNNQTLILEKAVKQIFNNKNYAISLKNQNGDIKIEAAVDKFNAKWRTFPDYHKMCIEEYETAWYYCVSYLNLMADLVQGRNKTVQNHLKNFYQLDILSGLLEGKYSLKEAEVPVIRLLHYLHIESESAYPIEKQQRILSYQNVGTQKIQMNTTPWDRKSWEDSLGKVFNCMIKKLQGYSSINPKDYKANECLYQVLNLQWEILNLGFYDKKQDLEVILGHILRILTPPDTSQEYYKECKKKSKNNNLMVKCKLECMKIIQYIFDFDEDIAIKRICERFKGFDFPDRIPRKVPKDQEPDYSYGKNFVVECYKSVPDTMLDANSCSKMIQLSKYGNPQLTSESLSVIRRILRSKELQIDKFTHVIFICEKERIQLANLIQQSRDKFFLLEDPNMINVSLRNQGSYYSNVYLEDTNGGIMQDMYTISELMKDQNSVLKLRDIKSLTASKMYSDLATNKLINFTDQRKSSNIMKQKVVHASNVHHKVLTYILNCVQFPKQELAKKLLHLSYKFMVCLIENYQDLKMHLLPYLGQIRHHIQQNLGCIDFMKEIYDNNKNMLFNEVQIVGVIKQICEIIDQLNYKQNYYKSKLLDFFRYLIFCNEKALSFNQIQILKIMQDDSFKNIFIQITPLEIAHLAIDYEKTNKHQQDKFKLTIQQTPELTYIETLYQIMGSLIQDKNKVNMGKLIKSFPFQTLMLSVKNAGTCWPLKRNIRAFMNRLYYFQPEIVDSIKTIMDHDIYNIIKDLNYYISMKVKSNVADYEKQVFQNPVRFSYLQSYLYLNLQQNLLTLNTIVTNLKLEEEVKQYLHTSKKKYFEDHYNIIRICERLGCIKTYFNDQKNIYTSSLIKFIMSKFKAIINEFDDAVYTEGMAKMGAKPQRTKSDKEEARKLLIQKIMIGDISTFFVTQAKQCDVNPPLVYQVPDRYTPPQQELQPNRTKLVAILRKILKREKRDFDNLDEEVSYKMEKLVTAIKLNGGVRKYFRTDYLQKFAVSAKQSATMFQYITVIIQMNSEDPTAVPPELKIFFLQLISCLVEQANEYQFPGDAELKALDQWSSEQIAESSKPKIHKIQRKFKKCELSRLLSDLMKQNIVDNIPLANSILLCGISYVITGYTATQMNLLDILKEDEDNRVMRNLESLIAKLGGLIRKNISENMGANQFKFDHFCATTIDNYDYYNNETKYCTRMNVFEPNSTNQELYSKLCLQTYRRAFKFLQLLCENNNIEGKNFIRQQPKSKVRQANFITIACKQLRTLFQVFCEDIKEIPMFLIEFLLEVTQVPVRTNQQTLMNLSFFEDLCALESFFRDQKNMKERKLKSKDALQEIYFKSIEIILSNFEGNEKNIVNLLNSKIDPTFLINIMKDKLQAIGVTSKHEMIDCINNTSYVDPEDERKNVKLHDDVSQLLNIIIIFLKVKEKLGTGCRIYESYLRQKEKDDKSFRLYNFLEECLLNIEITNDKGVNQIIYFPKIPVFNSLSQGLKDYVMSKVARSTHRDKIISLLGYTQDIKGSINYSYTMMKDHHISEQNLNNSYKIAAIMSVVVCVYMMNYYNVIIEYGDANFVSGRMVELGRFLLSLIQLSMSCVYMSYWFRLKIWYKPQYKSRDKAAEEAEDDVQEIQGEKNQDKKEDYPLQQLGIFNPRRYIRKLIPLYQRLQRLFVSNEEDGSKKEPEQTFYKCPQFYRIALFVGVSFLGTFFHPPLFFIHLIDIFCKNPMLANIFEAIAYSVTSLFYVCLMGVVFTFIFCTVTFSNYMKNIYSGSESPDQMCDTMFSCIMKLYVSGAIGGGVDSFQTMRFIYDMIYATFFEMLFANIVSGIMLDAFGSLRSLADQVDADKKNFCYICNISREKVQKNEQVFVVHIKKKHFLWNYVFYIYSLQLKDSTDYTGLEYIITSKYNRPDQDMDVSWIPVGDDPEFDCGQKIEKFMKKLQDFQEKIGKNVQDLQNRIKAFNIVAEEYAV